MEKVGEGRLGGGGSVSDKDMRIGKHNLKSIVARVDEGNNELRHRCLVAAGLGLFGVGWGGIN